MRMQYKILQKWFEDTQNSAVDYSEYLNKILINTRL